MSIELTGARFTVVHDAPAADATLFGARFTVVHDIPPIEWEGPQGERLVDRPLQGLVFTTGRFRED